MKTKKTASTNIGVNQSVSQELSGLEELANKNESIEASELLTDIDEISVEQTPYGELKNACEDVDGIPKDSKEYFDDEAQVFKEEETIKK